jgi:hypothetical protein
MDGTRKIGEFQVLSAIPGDFRLLGVDTYRFGLDDMNSMANNSIFIAEANSFWIGTLLMGIGGFLLLWPGVAEAKFIWSKTAGLKYLTDIFNALKTMSKEYIDRHKIWRLQLLVTEPLPDKFLRSARFEFEARLQSLSPAGTDVIIYKIITKKYLPDGGLKCH